MTEETNKVGVAMEQPPVEGQEVSPSPEPQQEIAAVTNTAPKSESSENSAGGNSNNANDTLDAEAAEAWGFALTQLARQLEYYLSVKNLSKDTYVQTLRSLNDGCVPVPILANFTKVKQILMSVGVFDEQTRIHAVWQASVQYSTKLKVVSIDTKTGKRKEDDSSSSGDDDEKANECTILAVGTIDDEPIAVLDPPITMPVSEVSNTIVLRDVVPQVTAEEIHQLFKFEGCPPVISIVPDVAQCWFVQFDARERSDVTLILTQLRGQTLAGEPVHARIKSSVGVASSTMIDPAPLMVVDAWQWQPPQRTKSNSPHQKRKGKKNNNNNRSNSRKNRNNGKNNNSSNGQNSKSNNSNNSNNRNNNNDASGKGSQKKNNNNKTKSTGTRSSNSTPTSTPTTTKVVAPPPPSLGEEDFPTLLDNRVEWETTPVQDEEANKANTEVLGVKDRMAEAEAEEEQLATSVKTGSDSASTATTASSSTEPPGVKKVGYAAALKKSDSKTALPNLSSRKKSLETPPTTPVTRKAMTETRDVETATEAIESSPVVVKPPSW
eukprot:CAMPEP_0168729342 /NCGR_PEP_ID=MMETSP0724-20121128/6150_1 /TAXON_ID=265536 /ORGANISM="Amphiprora sp., Strain CCMP467" /LENGTH=549 /DNA_ID=CAMNT_0008776215 /DNA_START=137 /DNA_END=1784 /DNA_ORIENTATION=+